MEMVLKQKLAEGTQCVGYQVIKLTEEEMRQVYEEYRIKVHFRDWIAELLNDYGYEEQDEEKLVEMAERYVDMMGGLEFGDRLGELENDAFVNMMDAYYSEIGMKEEE